ncbi:DUF3102 domain-containing protein [Mycobacterium sp. 94-17]|uniref:DUF3102 domain-containing protein n=1 Tax=Mycobacterium sp. 94-17 TaxID=2986147 RepID=UPI002D1F418E|nr:DUF3102 domain-containing protein [Mycobacterium sp. 94-17]MEB4210987.1 DUF3102 domain-containing protein [Mycobacterium sp. 94-17]
MANWEAQWDGFDDDEPDTTTANAKREASAALVKVSVTDFFDGADLAELSNYADKWHDQAVNGVLEAAWHSGKALLSAQRKLNHGEWIPWVTNNFKGSRSTAADYMRIASNADTPADVVSLTTSEDGTPMERPSINAVLKAIAKRDTKKRGTPKSSTIFNRWLKKLDAVATAAPNIYVGHLTTSSANDVASDLRRWIDALEDLYDTISAIADAEADEEQA